MLEETLRHILEETLGLPVADRDGLERALRERVSRYLLQDKLGWQQRRIATGEVYDLLCYDEDLIPVLYVETKTPRRSAIPASETKVALARARDLAVLQYMLLTDGRTYVLHDAETGRQLDSVRLDDSESRLESFFGSIRADQFALSETWEAQSQRIIVDRDRGGGELAQALRRAVDGLVPLFVSLLEQFYRRQVGCPFAEAAFRDWQVMSQRLPDDEIEAELTQAARQISSLEGPAREQSFGVECERLSKLVGVSRSVTVGALRALLIAPGTAGDEMRDIIHQVLQARSDFELLAVQTAHILLGRLLLYRVAEDKNLVLSKISGSAIQQELTRAVPAPLNTRPQPFYLDLYLRAREHMVQVDPDVYRVSLYDWWYVEPMAAEALTATEQKRLREAYGRLNWAIASVLHILNTFNLQAVESDVWREVYQHYLPREDRLHLGGFYTDEQLVRLIYELADYQGEDVLDPACGSGTFLVEAIAVARPRLEQEMPKLSRVARARALLEGLTMRIQGIDIHPLAVFLTRMNLFFVTLDLFRVARSADPDYVHHYKVFESDYLEGPGAQAAQLRMPLFLHNARARQTMEGLAAAEDLKASSPAFVVGNPPWGGVLRRGRPLWADPQTRRAYRERFRSARGKYDYYVPFVEQALDQLSDGGSLGFLTQNRFLTRDYGTELRKLLVLQTEDRTRSVKVVVDLGEVGGRFFFPEQTNYPCITIVSQSALPTAKLLRVSPDGPYEVNEANKTILVQAVRQVCSELDRTEDISVSPIEGVCIVGRIVDQDVLRRWAAEEQPWEMTSQLEQAEAEAAVIRSSVPHVLLIDAFTVAQGATTGNADNIFLLDEETLLGRAIESSVSRPTVRGRFIRPFKVDWPRVHAIYPYEPDGTLIDLGRDIWVGDGAQAQESVENAIAVQGRIGAPNAALYLVEFYEELALRTFEGRRLVDIGKQWFEWHRPRTPSLLTKSPKIVGRRQMRSACFAVDEVGFLPMDSCLAIVPLSDSPDWTTLTQYIASALGRTPTEAEVMNYVAAVLNSSLSETLLKVRNSPSQAGYYTIGEEHISRIFIPLPTDSRAKLVRALCLRKAEDATPLFS